MYAILTIDVEVYLMHEVYVFWALFEILVIVSINKNHCYIN